MGQLEAYADLADDVVQFLVGQVREHLAETEVNTGTSGEWAFQTHYGEFRASSGAPGRVRVSAADETRLAYMKMSVAGHVATYAGGAAEIRWEGHATRTGTPDFFRELEVIRSQRITPHLQRVRFAAADLDRFTYGGLHVRLLLPPKGRKPVWPTISEAGLLVWPSGDDALTVRVYTIRSIDAAAGWLDVDFVLHPGAISPGAAFAEHAASGERIGMIGPGGGEVPQAPHLLLAGDDTALPAIARILESLSPQQQATVFLEVDSPADVVDLPERDGISTKWLYRNGSEAGSAGLLSSAMDALDPASLPQDLYVWAGCEFSDFRAIRQCVRKRWGLPKDRQLIVAYWRRGMRGEEGIQAD